MRSGLIRRPGNITNYASAQEKLSILETNVESVIDTPDRDDEHPRHFHTGIPSPFPGLWRESYIGARVCCDWDPVFLPIGPIGVPSSPHSWLRVKYVAYSRTFPHPLPTNTTLLRLRPNKRPVSHFSFKAKWVAPLEIGWAGLHRIRKYILIGQYLIWTFTLLRNFLLFNLDVFEVAGNSRYI